LLTFTRHPRFVCKPIRDIFHAHLFIMKHSLCLGLLIVGLSIVEQGMACIGSGVCGGGGGCYSP
jgi:hypothetical protein